MHKDKETPAGKTLCSYANLYFQARNARMYRVIYEKGSENLAILGMDKRVFITDANAANNPTRFYPPSEGMRIIEQQWKIIQNDWVRMAAPVPCPIVKKYRKYHYQVMLATHEIVCLSRILKEQLRRFKRKKGVRIVVDIDPYSLL